MANSKIWFDKKMARCPPFSKLCTKTISCTYYTLARINTNHVVWSRGPPLARGRWKYLYQTVRGHITRMHYGNHPEDDYYISSRKPIIFNNVGQTALDTTTVIYLLTYSMVQSPSWEANWLAASQEIPRISRKAKVRYHTHKCLPTVPILGQPNPVLIPTYTSWISILILFTLLRLGLPSGLFPSGFSTKTLYTSLSSPIRATCPALLIFLYFITRTILGEEYRAFSSSLCSLPYSPVTSSLLGPNIRILDKMNFSNFCTWHVIFFTILLTCFK